LLGNIIERNFCERNGFNVGIKNGLLLGWYHCIGIICKRLIGGSATANDDIGYHHNLNHEPAILLRELHCFFV